MLDTTDDGALRLDSTLRRRQQVTFADRVLDPGNPLLRDCLGGRGALVVCTPAVERLYGRRLKAYLATLPGGAGTGVMVLHRTEATKSIDAALEVCDRAAAAGLRRMSPIVAIGGGVCTDICGLAAALHRRGVPHIKVPTTLVGLVDAGIGTKNAVNHHGRKSALGSFHPPEHSLLDAGFLATLPARHLVNGMAEILKLAVVRDAGLFALLEAHGAELAGSRLRTPAAAGERVIRRAVTGMLTELSANPYESVDYRRAVDFGHTFSPYVETASGHAVLHGEAVATDVALSSVLAHDLGLLDAPALERILAVTERLGLAPVWPGTDPDALWATLPGVADHRNGDLHLVVPTGIGSRAYLGLSSVGPRALRAAHDRLLRRAAGSAPTAPTAPTAGAPGSVATAKSATSASATSTAASASATSSSSANSPASAAPASPAADVPGREGAR